MKTNLVRTLSLTLLLSAPLALRALTGDPYEQKTQLNEHITANDASLTALRAQLPTAQPDAKKTNDIKLAIKTLEPKIKEEKAQLPALAARIKTLEPSADKMETLAKLRTSFPAIQAWTENDFKVCTSTQVPVPLVQLFQNAANAENTAITQKAASQLPYLVTHKAWLAKRKADKNYTLAAQPVAKVARETVQASDNIKQGYQENDRYAKKAQSGLTQQEYRTILAIRAAEEAERKNNSWSAWGSYAASFVYTPKALPHNEDKK